jgi:hypothetical protein
VVEVPEIQLSISLPGERNGRGGGIEIELKRFEFIYWVVASLGSVGRASRVSRASVSGGIGESWVDDEIGEDDGSREDSRGRGDDGTLDVRCGGRR